MNVRNVTNNSIIILRRNRIKILQKYENNDYYLVSSENAHLTVDKWSKCKALLAALTKNNELTKVFETTLNNEITIYENTETTLLFRKVALSYSTL